MSAPWDQSIAADLLDTVNELRGLNEEFGTRSHRVFLVWLRWTGTTRGAGEPTIDREIEIRPAPRVPDENTLRYRYLAGGATREGDLLLDEVPLPSPGTETQPGALSEDLLAGEPDGRKLPPNIDFFYELRPVTPGARAARYTLASKPKRDHGNLQWLIWLKHRDPDSPRDGHTAATATY